MEEIRETVREAVRTLRAMREDGEGDRIVIMYFPEPGQTITQIEDPVDARLEFIGEVFQAHRNWRMCILERTRNEC